MTKELVICSLADILTSVEIPSFDTNIPAGQSFPSPAVDFWEEQIDFNKILIDDKDSTFVGIVKGDSMKGAHIIPGTRIVISKAKLPRHGDIIVGVVCKEYTVKYYELKGDKIWLVPDNENYSPLEINEFHEFEIWGVVTWFINKPKPKYQIRPYHI